jgi:photosystem II stability/assembly factor-like uncharacterized protein
MNSIIFKITIFLLISLTCLKASDHWIEANNGISNLSISSIAIDKDDNIFAGNNGTGVWLSQNHGINWTQVNNGNSLNVISLATNDSVLVYAGTAGSGLYMTSNKGLTWAKIFEVEDTSHYIRSIRIATNNYVFISVDFEGIFYSTDTGFNWKQLNLNSHILNIINSLIVTPNWNIFVGTQDKGLWRTTSFGGSWDSLSCPSTIIKSLMMNAQGVIFAGNANGKIYRSYDNGNSWDERASLYYSVNQIIDSKEGVIYAALNNNGPYLSPDYGQLWGPYTYGIGKRTVFSICESNRDTLYCGTESGVFKTVLEAKPLTYPILAYPENDKKDMPLEIKFYWYRSRVAEKHEIVFSTKSDFLDIYQRAFVNENYYTIDNLSLNAEYYWKVRSIRQTDTSDWSEIRKFTTKLNAPILLTPNNFSKNLDTNIILYWEEVDNANSYILQIAKDSIFSENMLIFSGQTKTSSSHRFNAECDVKYYWRIKSKNQYSESDWSAVNEFSTKLSAPSLISPTDSTDDLLNEVNFEWDYLKNFSSFDFEISIDTNFKNIFYTYPNLKTKQLKVDKLDFGKRYFWRVKVRYGISYSYWSDVFTFRTGLRAPALITPENNSKGNPKEIQFKWDMGVLNDTTVINGYLVQISKYEDFKNILFEDSTFKDNTFLHNNFDYDTKYYWRVKANLNSYWTLFSDVWNFKIGLSKPYTVYPENQAKNIEIPVNFRWKSAFEFKNFTFQISDTSNMKNILFEQKNISDTCFLFSQLNYNTQYYWRIRYSTDSNFSLWSDIKSFRTAKYEIGIPILIFPEDSSINMDTAFYCIWSDPFGNRYSHLQVSGNMDFQNPVVDEDSLIERNYYVIGLKHNKKYYWRVRCGTGEDYGEFSNVFIFTTKSSVSVDDIISGDDLVIFPNPSKNTIKVSYNVENAGIVEFLLTDIFGNTSIINKEYKLPDSYSELLDLSNFPQGIYFLDLRKANLFLRQKLIILK